MNAIKKLEDLIYSENSNSLSDWNTNYFNVNKKRYQFEIKLIKDYYENGKILEIGAAPFHLSYILKEENYPVISVDIAPERFNQFITTHKLTVVACDIEREFLPFSDGEFDLVLFNEIFEHLRFNPIATLKEINRVLQPGGKLILSTPNLYQIRNVIKFNLGKGIDNPYKEFMKLYTLGHMGHIREYSVKQIKIFLYNTEFEPIKILHKSYNTLKGLWYPFNLVRRLIPQFNTYQIHVWRKL